MIIIIGGRLWLGEQGLWRRVGCEYETTTQNTKDIDAFTVHITPRAMLKRWDTGPPKADTDAFDKSWGTGQPPADIDERETRGMD